MTHVVLTGANGFLGWHTRCAAHSYGLSSNAMPVGDAFNIGAASGSLNGSKRLIHIAGVNRSNSEAVRTENVRFARQAAEALMRTEQPPATVVFANSIQAGNQTPYGTAKQEAADILRKASEQIGVDFIDLKLPNLFGEHGRPFYNSVVATFCDQLASGMTPAVEQDRELALLHAQDAADALLGEQSTEVTRLHERRETVTGLLDRLQRMESIYSRTGGIPDISHPFDRDLFNTLRSTHFLRAPLIDLRRNADERGAFFEVVRSSGGPGQTSFSTTRHGVTRGQHYHRRKIERFTVLSGEAVIALRRLFTGRILRLCVSGSEPASVDMPTMWTHNITNVGDQELYTSFWANELFDSEQPDTIAEPV